MMTIILSALTLLSTTSALASNHRSDCNPIEIRDPSSAQFSDARVTFYWDTLPIAGIYRLNAKGFGFRLARTDGKTSALKELGVSILKRVEFDTRKYQTEGANILETIATYQLRITSDRYQIGTEISGGDTQILAKEQIAIVVCREREITPW